MTIGPETDPRRARSLPFVIAWLGLLLYMLLWRIRHGEITPAYYAPLEVVAIYWSFVDTVWLFLYPCIYLVGRS